MGFAFDGGRRRCCRFGSHVRVALTVYFPNRCAGRSTDRLRRTCKASDYRTDDATTDVDAGTDIEPFAATTNYRKIRIVSLGTWNVAHGRVGCEA